MSLEVVRQFDVAVTPETSVCPVSGGFSGARIWRVETASGHYALRRWPDRSLPPARIQGLHALLRHIAHCGCSQVAVPVTTSAGSTLITHSRSLWQCEPWLGGRADFHQQPTDARLRSVMEALARWHLAAAQFRPEPDVAEWFGSVPAAPAPAVTERLRLATRWLAGELDHVGTALAAESHLQFAQLGTAICALARQSLPGVISELTQVAGEAFPLQPCLRDMWHDHVLFEGETVSGIIDPSACRTESVASDLSRLLGSLLADEKPRWDRALTYYSGIRPLSIRETQLVGILDRSAVVLSPLNWLRRRYVQRVPFSMEAILPRLTVQQQRLLALVQQESC